MPIKKIICHPLAVLIVLCLGIGIYKIAVQACVSNDSVTFMEFARELKLSPGEAIRSYDQHPGYPAIICASEWILSKLGGGQALEHRIIAAQAATLICRTIAVCFLFSIFRFLGNKKGAFLCTILVMLIPVYANIGSEVLSDWPNLMLMAVALFFCLKGLRGTSVLCFLWAGVFSGLAYWIRPEGAVFVMVVAFYTLYRTFNSANRLKLWACLGTMVIAASLVAGPYMICKGALFPKKKVGTFSLCMPVELLDIPIGSNSQNTLHAGFLGTSESFKPAKAIFHFIEELFNTIFVLSIPLVGMFIYKMKRYGRLRCQDQFLILFAVLWLGLMIWLHCKHGYMSHRHIMPLVVFGFAWMSKGLRGLALVFGRRRCDLYQNSTILTAICIMIFVPKLIRPAHADKAAYRQVGLWLKDNTPAEATLAVFDNRIGFYAERAYTSSQVKDSTKPDYFILKASEKPAVRPEKGLLITTGQLTIDTAIWIYQLSP